MLLRQSTQPTSQQINKPANQLVNIINEPTNRSTNQPCNHSVNLTSKQASKQASKQKRTNQTDNGATDQQANQPTTQPTKQPLGLLGVKLVPFRPWARYFRLFAATRSVAQQNKRHRLLFVIAVLRGMGSVVTEQVLLHWPDHLSTSSRTTDQVLLRRASFHFWNIGQEQWVSFRVGASVT